ncbi:hypothetical protein V6N12_016314 [Hibiscus sabdariffa]|uniref:Uncharacterized protein n=1 Tax=Hibiscus sabdariffa TaxID=183260 RepID=A0ABR2CF68_9ROSI
MTEIIETYEANARMMKQNSEMLQKILRQVKLLTAHLGIVDEGEIRRNEKDWAKQDEPEHHVFNKLSTLVATEIVDGTIQDRIGGSIDVPVIINSVDSDHDSVIAADVNAYDLIWGVFTECGVGCDEDSSAIVTGHIASDDYNKSDLSLENKKITTPIFFRDIGHSLKYSSAMFLVSIVQVVPLHKPELALAVLRETSSLVSLVVEKLLTADCRRKVLQLKDGGKFITLHYIRHLWFVLG